MVGHIHTDIVLVRAPVFSNTQNVWHAYAHSNGSQVMTYTHQHTRTNTYIGSITMGSRTCHRRNKTKIVVSVIGAYEALHIMSLYYLILPQHSNRPHSRIV